MVNMQGGKECASKFALYNITRFLLTKYLIKINFGQENIEALLRYIAPISDMLHDCIFQTSNLTLIEKKEKIQYLIAFPEAL